MSAVDFVNIIAARKAGGVPGWRWCSLEALGAAGKECDILAEGGVPTEVFRRGPRKGETKWKGVPMTRVVVTAAELAEARREHENLTGRCHVCDGEGETNVGWTRESGPTVGKCVRCDGTGEAPRATEPTP